VNSDSSQRYIIIDSSGDLFTQTAETPIVDFSTRQELLRHIKLDDSFRLKTSLGDEPYWVECYDHPLLVNKLEVREGRILVFVQCDLVFEADAKKFSVDFEDRFCGLTTSGAPFRLTAKAQDRLFKQCEDFDDDGFNLSGMRVQTPPYYFGNADITSPNFWVDFYAKEGQPNWDLQAPARAFVDMLPRMKLPKSRILVLGAGEGHDAALFAEAGHVVTAVDFSSEGIHRGRERYGHLRNLRFVQENIFNLPSDWNHSFDIVIEHTCFCAIPPEQRKDLVTLWRRLLHEEGQLMGVFFAMLKRAGPPYGSSEHEIRYYLEKYFQFLFWGRWRDSLPRRQARELFVLAKKR
jgi:SAM-dependent methyltransferase